MTQLNLPGSVALPTGKTSYIHPRWGKREIPNFVPDLCTAIRLSILGYSPVK